MKNFFNNEPKHLDSSTSEKLELNALIIKMSRNDFAIFIWASLSNNCIHLFRDIIRQAEKYFQQKVV